MVLKRLFKPAAKPQVAIHSVPADQRLYAIGDVHGRLDLLDRLIDQIDRDDAARGPADTWLIFLGDLVDRGPDSYGVVDRLLRLKQSDRNVRVLMGNHEEVFLLAARGDVQALRLFLRIGGKETVLSYGVSRDDFNQADFERLAALLSEHVPAEHIAFLESFEQLIEVGDYLFVHAGIRPGIAIGDQEHSDLRWIRGDFLNHSGSHGKMVVHGHSITPSVDVQANRIGIDTGAYASDRLSAIGLQGSERWFLSTAD